VPIAEVAPNAAPLALLRAAAANTVAEAASEVRNSRARRRSKAFHAVSGIDDLGACSDASCVFVC
jgi:hypothetical protein